MAPLTPHHDQVGPNPNPNPNQVIISQMLLADIEVGVLGDGLSNALRQALHAPPTQPPAHSGAALLLRETVGGNGRTLLLGCVTHRDPP